MNAPIVGNRVPDLRQYLEVSDPLDQGGGASSCKIDVCFPIGAIASRGRPINAELNP
jgi:hypothetical protein